jgi:hypothetical protein
VGTYGVAKYRLCPASFTLAFIPGVVLAATGNFVIVGPMTVMVMPLSAVLGSVMFCITLDSRSPDTSLHDELVARDPRASWMGDNSASRPKHR